MTPYHDLHLLYDFLKSITTIEEFFERKEPDFTDAAMRDFATWQKSAGIEEDVILSALKSSERNRATEELERRKASALN